MWTVGPGHGEAFAACEWETFLIDVYRFILALCVMQGHLLGGGEGLAWQAVFPFYVLSGFLMSLILNQGYGFTAGGLARFAVNHWLLPNAGRWCQRRVAQGVFINRGWLAVGYNVPFTAENFAARSRLSAICSSLGP